jgi:homoserine O-acetyltransferase
MASDTGTQGTGGGTIDPSTLPGEFVTLAGTTPLDLDSGARLGPINVAYTTHGTLNADKSNAILICHALTGDQFFCGTHPLTERPGWWDTMAGPGKPLDTDRYFLICPNILGGCMGTTGPSETNPATGKPWGLDFPVITIGDIVNVQKLLVDHLGIDRLFSVIGGSMGGMQALDWAARFPERVFSVMPIATALRTSAQNIAHHEVGRQAVMADPDWCGGRYQEEGKRPHRGLAVARMGAHITYLSESALTRKFGRALQARDRVTYGFEADFQVESYLRHQGITFVDRFDANSYLYITKAMDYFDMVEEHGGVATDIFAGTNVRFGVISFTSDWMFPTAENREIVKVLNGVGANVSFVEIETDQGHDSFLMDIPDYHRVVRGFLEGTAELQGAAAGP